MQPCRTAAPLKYHEGHDFIGSLYVPASGEKAWGALRAIEPLTGEKLGVQVHIAAMGRNPFNRSARSSSPEIPSNFIALDARKRARIYGTYSLARPSTRRPSRTCSTASNTW